MSHLKVLQKLPQIWNPRFLFHHDMKPIMLNMCKGGWNLWPGYHFSGWRNWIKIAASPFLSILYWSSCNILIPGWQHSPPPSPCWDACMVWSAPPLSYVSAMVVSIGRRSNDSACLLLCTFPRWCTPDEETRLIRNRASEAICRHPEQLPALCPSESEYYSATACLLFPTRIARHTCW